MWDFRRDGETGDWVFAGNRDFMGISGDDLTKQRITIRTRIPRGEYIYDKTKTLGSRLYEALRWPNERALRDAPSMIEEALEPMSDISVSRIEPELDEKERSIMMRVFYTYVVQPNEPLNIVATEEFNAVLPLAATTQVGVSIAD